MAPSGDGAGAGAGLPASRWLWSSLHTGLLLSVALTSAPMLATPARHAPACAATLIVSLGILASPRDALVMLGSVVALYWVHVLVRTAESRLLARRPGGH